MATVTVTVATSLDNPRGNLRGGVTSKAFTSGNVTYGGAGDVLLLARIPNKARVVGVFGGAQCAATSVAAQLALCRVESIGTGGTLGTVSVMANIGSLTVLTAGINLANAMVQPVPQKVSLSDDAAVQFAMLALVASGGTQSTSFSINGVLLYEVGGHAS